MAATQLSRQRAELERVTGAPALPGSAWTVLGVPAGAAQGAWSSAYKRLALVLHPDKCKLPGAEEAFKKVASARDAILSGLVDASPPPRAPPAQAQAAPPPFWRRRAAGGERRSEPRQRSLRNVGLVADAAWAALANKLGGRKLSQADISECRTAALKMQRVWARRHKDSVSECLQTTPAERAAAAAVVEVAGRLVQRLDLRFCLGDTLLPERQLRRRSQLGVARGAAGKNCFRGGCDGTGHFALLEAGDPLREHAGRARPRFRFQLKCSSLNFSQLTDSADKVLLPAEAALRSDIHAPDANFSSSAARKALVESDYLVLLVVALPGFGRGVVGRGHTNPAQLWEDLLATAVPHWAVVADGALDRRLFDHTGVFSAVARRRVGLPAATEGVRGGRLQDPLLSMRRAWELRKRLATQEWEVEEDAAIHDLSARRLRYTGYVLARTLFLHSVGDEDEDSAATSRVEVLRLLGKKLC
jgi:hypothetical protein